MIMSETPLKLWQVGWQFCHVENPLNIYVITAIKPTFFNYKCIKRLRDNRTFDSGSTNSASLKEGWLSFYKFIIEIEGFEI